MYTFWQESKMYNNYLLLLCMSLLMSRQYGFLLACMRILKKIQKLYFHKINFEVINFFICWQFCWFFKNCTVFLWVTATIFSVTMFRLTTRAGLLRFILTDTGRSAAAGFFGSSFKLLTRSLSFLVFNFFFFLVGCKK